MDADSLVSRPGTASLMPLRLSQHSLHQLERNANANPASRDSRIQNWVHGLAPAAGSLVDVNLYQDAQTPFDMATQYVAGFGQPFNYGHMVGLIS
jgi:hypothetical protein